MNSDLAIACDWLEENVRDIPDWVLIALRHAVEPVKVPQIKTGQLVTSSYDYDPHSPVTMTTAARQGWESLWRYIGSQVASHGAPGGDVITVSEIRMDDQWDARRYTRRADWSARVTVLKSHRHNESLGDAARRAQFNMEAPF